MKNLMTVVLVFTVVLASSTGLCGQTTDIVIGTCGALTGSASAYGKSVLSGVELAIEELNQQGYPGLNARFSLVSKDDEQLEVVTSEAMTSLVYDENALAVIGTTDSGCTHVAARTAFKSKTPLVATVATDPTLTRLNNPYVFRNLADDLIQGEVLVNHIVRDRGLSRICVLHINTRYGLGGSKVVRDVAARTNTTITMVDKYERNQQQFTDLVAKVRRDRHDAIIIWGLYSEGAALVKELRAAGVISPIFAPDGLATPAFVELAKDDANGVTVTWPFDPDKQASDPVVRKFVEAYQKKYNRIPDSFAAHAYDATYLIARSAAVCGVSRKGITQGLRKMKDFHGVCGVFTLDDAGNSTLPVFLAIIENQQFKTLK